MSIYTDAEVLAAARDHRDRSFAAAYVLQLELAAECAPDLIRDAVGRAMGLTGLDDQLRRTAAGVETARKSLYELGEAIAQRAKDLERVEERVERRAAELAAIEQRIDAARAWFAKIEDLAREIGRQMRRQEQMQAATRRPTLTGVAG